MTSGVYPRDTMQRDYHGFRRLQMVKDADGKTEAIVAASCDDCGCDIERTSAAVKLARRKNRGFTCKKCNAARTRQKRALNHVQKT